jgi:hypothetical protein
LRTGVVLAHSLGCYVSDVALDGFDNQNAVLNFLLGNDGARKEITPRTIKIGDAIRQLDQIRRTDHLPGEARCARRHLALLDGGDALDAGGAQYKLGN